ncbi:MAG: sulfite exporter TauE/SafE family protein [Acidobacteria bacterium]|nr:MAG: sulfite exporter TauE/SafE family protein [Acidobacteriota bacterium]
MPIDFGLVVAGFVVGLLIGVTGMGGGAVMTPFLISVVGVGPVVAVGTDLVYSAATKIVGAWLHVRQQTVDLALVKRLAIGSVPAGLAAVAVIGLLPEAGVDADQAVRRALGAVLVLVALVMLCRLFVTRERPLPERWRTALEGRGTIAAGAIVGALVGFTSVGSGALLVPFLLCVFPLSPARVVGTDVFHAAILVSVTGLAHAQGGTVDWLLAATLLLGSVPGVYVGTWMAPRAPVRILRAGLASLLLITGLSLM